VISESNRRAMTAGSPGSSTCMADIMADMIDLRHRFVHYAGGRSDRAGKLPRLALPIQVTSGDA
jgi:hypothetical protein